MIQPLSEVMNDSTDAYSGWFCYDACLLWHGWSGYYLFLLPLLELLPVYGHRVSTQSIITYRQRRNKRFNAILLHLF